MTDIPPPPSVLEYLLMRHVDVSNELGVWFDEYKTSLHQADCEDTDVYDRLVETHDLVDNAWWETHHLNEAIGGHGQSGRSGVTQMVHDIMAIISQMSTDAVPFEKMRMIRMLDALSWYDHLDNVKDIRTSMVANISDDIPATVMDGDVADMVDMASQMDMAMGKRGDH